MSENDTYQPYEVALWRLWPSLFPEYVDVVYATSSQQAVLFLMELQDVERVAKAAVQSPGGTIERWRHVDVGSLREGDVTVEVRLVWMHGSVVPLEEPTDTISEVIA